MRIETSPTRDDFLTFQLYTASQSLRSRRRRYSSWLIGTLFLAAIGVGGFLLYGALPWTSIAIPAVVLVGYPFYSDWRYRRHFEKHIDEYYGARIGRTTTLEIRDGKLIAESEGSRAELDLATIRGIVEISSHYFLYLDKASAVLLARGPERGAGVEEFVGAVESSISGGRVDMTDWRWWFFARHGPDLTQDEG